ncbi:7785_t:CDS:2 [Paraglomus occultum]|uniref:7785_t:CDS:1 n=1 Tax=Paraglomus occultum TaxID=144539 RepID=A0A9N9AFW2_9GLOM|nr:7785_t:CDS:2 [Paraglomus occultum]
MKTLRSRPRVPSLFRTVAIVLFLAFVLSIFHFANIRSGHSPRPNPKPDPEPELPTENNFTNEDVEGLTSRIRVLVPKGGHTFQQLKQLESTWKPKTNATAPLTVIILYVSEHGLERQLRSIAEQSARPRAVWIITPDNAAKAAANRVVRGLGNDPVIVHTTEDDHLGPFAWLKLAQHVTTEHIVLLDNGVVPGLNYFANMLRVANVPVYSGAVIGSMGTVISKEQNLRLTCFFDHTHGDRPNHDGGTDSILPEKSRPVDMINHVWFLRKQWISLLLKENRPDAYKLPLSFFISFALKYQANIPSFVIPTALTDANSWGDVRHGPIQGATCGILKRELATNVVWKKYLDRGYPLVTQQKIWNQVTTRVATFAIDGIRQARALVPLICKMSRVRETDTHVVVTGIGRGLDRGEMKKLIDKHSSLCSSINIYDLDVLDGPHFGLPVEDIVNIVTQIEHGLTRIMQYTKPQVIIYIKEEEEDSYGTQGFAEAASKFAESAGIIAIPSTHIPHVMWIPDLPIRALKQWNTPQVQVHIITQKRVESLKRLMKSVATAYYLGDKVSLTINMDRSADQPTIEYSRAFKWLHGEKHVHFRVVQGGLLPAVAEAYYPAHDEDYGVVLEDDVELSPFWYVWTKYTILKYRHATAREVTQRMFGVSFYGQKAMELPLPGRIYFSPDQALEGYPFPSRTPYLCQVPCSWGAVYFPEIWREFHDYLLVRIEDWNTLKFQNVTIPWSRSNKWRASWKKFLIELTYLRGYVMLYPNFEEFASFSNNHAEIGEHMHLKPGKVYNVTIFQVPLMQNDVILQQLPKGSLPSYKELPILDLWGNVTSSDEIIERGNALHANISLCSIPDELTYDPQDLLCIDEDEKARVIEEARIQAKKEARMYRKFKAELLAKASATVKHEPSPTTTSEQSTNTVILEDVDVDVD